MELEVVKEFSFDAAHYLPKHEGVCQHMHGHRYVLQVGFRGEVDTKTGMVVDFGDVSRAVKKEVIDKLDHTTLNGIVPEGPFPFPAWNPTAELMVGWVICMIGSLTLKSTMRLSYVRLYETPTSFVTWRRKAE